MNPDLFLSCVADPTRHALLDHLRRGPARVVDLVEATGQSQSNVSHHLKQLRDCGLVAYEREGKANRYRLAHPSLETFLDTVERTAEALAPLCRCEVCA